jgi:hypothetical protein
VVIIPGFDGAQMAARVALGADRYALGSSLFVVPRPLHTHLMCEVEQGGVCPKHLLLSENLRKNTFDRIVFNENLDRQLL